MPYDKHRMQDISISEKQLWLQYLQFIESGDFDNANTLLSQNPNLKYKVFNAFNWNRLQNMVNDGTEWTIDSTSKITTDSSTDCLAGKFANDNNRLVDVASATTYAGVWQNNVSYKKNNLVKTSDGFSYICIFEHTSSDVNKPPNENFWVLATQMKESVGIPVATELPEGAQLYFRFME